MTSEKGSRKDKNQNIQVFVRLRPLNQRERDIKSLGVIEVAHNREVIVRQSQQSNHTKKFTFDRAFAPQAKQVEVYQEVVSPLIEEVLAGYNCTVFAYGQTGTGKTHTMVGESTGDEHTWQNDPLAGIIPRSLSQLFDELRLSNTEYTVRVSYLELYNEELFDLLSASEDNSKLRIYEDVTRKGSNIVNGLEEITVSNKNEVYKIMAQGQERKRVASTLMNAQSSNQSKSIFKRNFFTRSHTVFTIVVHMRENSPEGEELVKIGKLNLVDLAGSENISKAGSDNPAKRERARECVNINQSLLTLGRVITALVERHPHIPYRESKLTRILQESLGGRTKTSIIATISPGHKDLEETMSTLEYANRAKNIQNKPEVNQKMTKKAILKEYAEEIDRLKRDLQASRDKNGVYLATDTYAEITLKQEEQRKEIQELLLQKRAVEEQKDKVETLFSEINKALEKRDTELNETKSKLTTVETNLVNTANLLQTTKQHCLEQRHLVEQVSGTERALTAQARTLLAAAERAAGHAACLHDSVDKWRSVESRNLQTTRSYRSQAAQQRAGIAAGTQHVTLALTEALGGQHAGLARHAAGQGAALRAGAGTLDAVLQQMQDAMDEIRLATEQSHGRLAGATGGQRALAGARAGALAASAGRAAGRAARRAAAALQAARARSLPGTVAAHVQDWYAGATARVASLCETQRSFVRRMQDSAASHAETLDECRRSIHARKEQKDELVRALNEKVERDNAELEKRLSEQMSEVETERRDTEGRLRRWMDDERRLFEERLRSHVEAETAAMEHRLSKKLESINLERDAMQTRLAAHHALQGRLLEAGEAELAAASRDLQAWEAARGQEAGALGAYRQEFDDGTSAISTDMEVFSTNVVEVVDHIYQELLAIMELADKETQEDAEAVLCEVQSAGAELVAGTNSAMDDVESTYRTIVDDMLQTMEVKNNSTASTLREMSASLGALAAAAAEHVSQHGAATGAAAAQLAQFEDRVAGALRCLEEVEGRCLAEEYKVYSPTGKTPSRTEYRYPRALAATSPHERILARFRAMRQNSHDEDCIVVESDEGSRAASDCESSASEDFAVFVAPSPPADLAAPAAVTPRRGNAQPIIKCTSESDIYSYKRNQDNGKENANRSINYKKPSKLPAPSSLKKPFVERNGNDN